MAKDLIIGGASNYTWDHLKHWVNSIKRSGFTGDIVLVATNISNETIERLVNEGVKLSVYGTRQEDGSFKNASNGAPHVERFFYMWNFLNENGHEYDYVFTTDTRDVVFQTNPTAWIDEAIFEGYQGLIVSSEGMNYEDEPWNDQNLKEAFGPFFHNKFKGMEICNVGVIGGEMTYVRDMLFMIFQMSINRPVPIVDQVVFNILLQQQAAKDTTKICRNEHAWAAQLGTTLEAIKSGAGDLGYMLAQIPEGMEIYEKIYKDKQPTLTDDGVVVNHNGMPFVIVHQYDRTKAWAEKIKARYEDV